MLFQRFLSLNCFRINKPFAVMKSIERFSSIDSNNKEPAKKKDNPKISYRKDILQKTPIGKLDEFEGKHPYEEKEPLPGFPDGVNPVTGEIGGPKGPEPTRYGDWERKGRVSDF